MTGASLDVLCVGILVADVFASPLPRLPGAGEILLVDELLLQTGGCAANTGVDLVNLGARVAVVGKVGEDIFGEFIRRDLAGKGLDVSGIRSTPRAPTSCTVILPVVGEDRRYVHCVGANAELAIEDVSFEAVAEARALYVGGYLLLPKLTQSSLAELFQFARGRGVKTVLDVAGAQPRQGLGPLRQVLPYTDLIKPNDDEARAMTGESDPVRQVEALVAAGADTVVVSLGGRGAVAKRGRETVRAGVFPVDVVDPSGAGDAFDAGFIHGLIRGWDLRQSLQFASAIGASACTKLGCTAGVFTQEQASEYLRQNRLEIAGL